MSLKKSWLIIGASLSAFANVEHLRPARIALDGWQAGHRMNVHPRIFPQLRYKAFTPAQQQEILGFQRDTAALSNRREAVAVYDDQTETIFLPDTWKGDTPSDLSVLVHEMVHHLQNKAHIKYECAGAREEAAYAAQEKWLDLFGRSLFSEFQVDPFTLKVSTTCGF